MTLHRMLCKIGVHQWMQSRELVPNDLFPFAATWEPPTRKCSCCGMEQWWLPGYGGSEEGCWMNGRRLLGAE